MNLIGSGLSSKSRIPKLLRTQAAAGFRWSREQLTNLLSISATLSRLYSQKRASESLLRRRLSMYIRKMLVVMGILLVSGWATAGESAKAAKTDVAAMFDRLK